MSRNEKFAVGLALAALLLWLLLSNKGTATVVTGSSSSKLIIPVAAGGSAQIATYQPTQLGLPQSALLSLSYAQCTSDVAYFVDPSNGYLIANAPGLINGNIPLVALTDTGQINLWMSSNPMAVQDMDINSGAVVVPGDTILAA